MVALEEKLEDYQSICNSSRGGSPNSQLCGGARGKGRGSPKSVGFIQRGTWMFVQTVMSIHAIVLSISIWIEVVNQPTDSQILLSIHAASVAKNPNKEN